MKQQETNIHSSPFVNPWITESSTYPPDYQASSSTSFMKNERKKPKKLLPSSTVGIVIDDPSSEKHHKGTEANIIDNKRRCPLWLTVVLAIIAVLSLIALIVILCVLLPVPNASTTVTTTLQTTTITTATTIKVTTTTMTVTTTTVTTTTVTTTTTTTTTTTSTMSSNITVGVPPLFRWNSTGTTVAGAVTPSNTASNRLNVAYSLTLDSSDTLYIADSNNNRIQKWLSGASNGTTVAGQATGKPGTNSTYLQNPAGVAVNLNGDVYVTDYYNHRVQLWLNGASSGTTVVGTGIAGSSNNQLSFPYGIALDSNTGTLYVADQTNHRVMRYFFGATTGSVVAGGNGAGTNNTQLSSPCGIYFDSSTSSLIIANFAANNIVRWPIGAGSWTLVAGSINGISGNTAVLLDRPMSVVLDPWGNAYVADTYNQRVQFFLAGQSNGTTIAGVTSTPGSTSNLFRYPYALALDSQYNLYVSDTYNFRIQKLFRY